MTLAKWIEFTSVTDTRGALVAAEVDRHIPFPIKRVYFLTDLKRDEPRGFHAHRALQQVAVCLAGSCQFVLDNGSEREQLVLDRPSRGVHIGNMIWREMHDFSEDCVLAVFASEFYDEADYIRDYKEYLAARHESTEPKATIHPLADVGTSKIGPGTRVWQYVVVLDGASVGKDCNICAHVLIEGGVLVGDRVTVKSGVQLWDGVTLEDDVFVGPNVTFSNDRFPRSRQRPEAFERTVVARGASIGANATILPGVRIGAGAMVGAGAVVTRDVPEGATVYGNPARSSDNKLPEADTR